MTKYLVKAQFSSTGHDCECCGSFWDDKVEITCADGRKVVLESDGHFGYGDWSGQKIDFLKYVALYHGIRIFENGHLISPGISESVREELESIINSRDDVDVINFDMQYEDAPSGEGYIHKAFYESPKVGRHEFCYEYIEGNEDNKDWDGSEEQMFEKMLSHYIEIVE